MATQQNPDLTEEQKDILFNGGTEVPGTGALLHNDKTGMYTCANCGKDLFKSDSKYESTIPGLIGWPSFAEASDSSSVIIKDDNSIGMLRQEAVCSNCGVHLGHLFPDDTSPTGQHYCINSASLGFNEKK